MASPCDGDGVPAAITASLPPPSPPFPFPALGSDGAGIAIAFQIQLPMLLAFLSRAEGDISAPTSSSHRPISLP